MRGGNLQATLFLMNRPEPIRQSALLMVLATGIGDASTLLAGLKALAEESSPPWSNRITQLRILLEQGQTLSGALTGTQGLLPETTLLAIRMGEQTGTLKQILADEAHRLMAVPTGGNPVRASLPNTIGWISAVGLVGSFVVSFIMLFIIPKFKKIFEDFGIEMPGPTLALIDISDWFLRYWFLAVLPIATVLVFAVGHLMHLQYQQMTRGRVIFAEHFPRYWSPLLLRLLSVAVAAGQSISDALHATLQELRPGRAATRLSAVRMKVDAGVECWEAMYQEGFLTQREIAFLESAKRSRHLDWGLIHLSRTILRRRERWAQRIAALLQPVMVVFAGIVVGFVVISLFLPLLKLINDLS